jgi:hypothetical protein
MGTDIDGWVETLVSEYETAHGREELWHEILSIGQFVNREYLMFASLFGVRNKDNIFHPIAANRGLPPFPSDASKRLQEWGCENITWIGWDEIQAIDWTEKSLKPVMVTRSEEDPHKLWMRSPEPGRHSEEYITRGDVLHGYEEGNWPYLFSLMEQIYNRIHPDDMRLVVGFG